MATEDRAPLILTGVTPHGTTKFVRHTPAHAGQYADAFKGFFSADTKLSREFFTTLLESNRWLTGHEDPPPGGGPGGDLPPSPMPDFFDQTKSLAMNRRKDRRLQLLVRLMMPSQFPLVVMAT